MWTWVHTIKKTVPQSADHSISILSSLFINLQMTKRDTCDIFLFQYLSVVCIKFLPAQQQMPLCAMLEKENSTYKFYHKKMLLFCNFYILVSYRSSSQITLSITDHTMLYAHLDIFYIPAYHWESCLRIILVWYEKNMFLQQRGRLSNMWLVVSTSVDWVNWLCPL